MNTISVEEVYTNVLLNTINWDHLYWNYKLSDEVLEEFKDKLNWHQISIYQSRNISEKTIERFANYLEWDYLAMYRELSEELIEKYHNKMLWDTIMNLNVWISKIG